MNCTLASALPVDVENHQWWTGESVLTSKLCGLDRAWTRHSCWESSRTIKICGFTKENVTATSSKASTLSKNYEFSIFHCTPEPWKEKQRERKRGNSRFFFSLSSFLTNIHWRALTDSHPALMELYEGSVLDGLPRLSHANDFTPCSSVIGSLLLIFCQRVTSLARSYCANRQH